MAQKCFGSEETNDFWADCLRYWWTQVRAQHRGIRRLVIHLDNGPKNSGSRNNGSRNSGSRTQFLKRLTELADGSGLKIRLVYGPPYHRKYKPIERCWSSLQIFVTEKMERRAADQLVGGPILCGANDLERASLIQSDTADHRYKVLRDTE